VTEKATPVSQLAQQNPLHALMVVVGVLLVAVTAKLGHGIWGVGGMLGFYPAYLAMLAAGRSAAAVLARMSIPQSPVQQRAYARICVRQ
jgi:hypothetical protein